MHPCPENPSGSNRSFSSTSCVTTLVFDYQVYNIGGELFRCTSSDENAKNKRHGRLIPQEPHLFAVGQAAALINLGLQQRNTAQTIKNDISSRSHTVLTVNLEQRGGTGLPSFASAEDVASMAGRYAGSRVRSKLVLVDLAGSERGKRSSIYLHQGTYVRHS